MLSRGVRKQMNHNIYGQAHLQMLGYQVLMYYLLDHVQPLSYPTCEDPSQPYLNQYPEPFERIIRYCLQPDL